MNDELNSLYELATQPIHNYYVEEWGDAGVCINIPLHVVGEVYTLTTKIYTSETTHKGGGIASCEMTLSRDNYDILTFISNREGSEWVRRIITHYPVDTSWRTMGGAFRSKCPTHSPP